MVSLARVYMYSYSIYNKRSIQTIREWTFAMKLKRHRRHLPTFTSLLEEKEVEDLKHTATHNTRVLSFVGKACLAA